MAKDKPAPAGAPAWMVTFADLMSLLVCFFVLIISFSIQDEQKLQVVAGSVRDAFGVRRDWQARALVEIDGRPKTKKIKLPPNHNIVVYMPRPERPPPEDAQQDDEAQDPSSVSSAASSANQAADESADSGERLLASAADFLELSDYAGEATHAQIGPSGGVDGGEGDSQANRFGDSTDWRKRFEAARVEQQENQLVEELLAKIEALAQARPELANVLENMKVERADQGVRIEMVDDLAAPMFQLGSTDLSAEAQPVIAEVAALVAGTDNRLLITGHTDSRPFRGRRGYDNWNLSSDRAHATRRALIAAGVKESQIAGVLGRADADHANPADPYDPRNRRIGILLLRDDDLPTTTAAAPTQ